MQRKAREIAEKTILISGARFAYFGLLCALCASALEVEFQPLVRT
jgi:hypothetical protein